MSGSTKNNDEGADSLIEQTAINLDEPLEEVSLAARTPKYGFLEGLGLVIGLQVGSGIFSSPNQVHKLAGSIGASLLLWCVSGLLAWSGASCYAELGCAIPASGGAQAYLTRAFGDHVAFLYSWTAIAVLKPGSAAIIATVLSDYVSGDAIVKRVVAILAVGLVTLINFFEYGAGAGTFFLGFKAVLLLAITVLGFVLTPRRDHAGDHFWAGTHSLGDLVGALYGGVWAYDGWDNLNFVAGEMRNPTRDLSRVISTAMPTVICAYCLVNSSYFGALSGPQLDSSESVALTVASLTNSRAVEVLVAGGICVSCAGALNASMVSMAKLVQVAAQAKIGPQFLSQHKWALLFQSFVTICYCCVGEFGSLVTFYGAAGYIFYLLTVIGLLVLRYREPGLERPYRTWLIAPVAFVILSVALLLRTAMAHPLLLLLVLAFIAVGSPLYLFTSRKTKRSASNTAR